MRKGKLQWKEFLNYVTYALSLILGGFIVYAPLKRGMFFREDYLRFLPWIAWVFLGVLALSILQGRKLWHLDVDWLLSLLVAVYWLTAIWAVSKKTAMDGALKYASYFLIFLVSRYLSQDAISSKILRTGIIVSGVVSSLVGLLSAAKIIQYPSAVVGGKIYGSFQYPNALAAYAMFIGFICLYAWNETDTYERLWIRWVLGFSYSLSYFFLMTVLVLSYSRATWLIFGASLALYFAFLPTGQRVPAFVHFIIPACATVATNSPLAAAILNGGYLATRRYLIIGITITAILETLELSLQLFRRSRLKPDSTYAGSILLSQPERENPRRKFFALIVIGCIVIAACLGLFTTAAGEKLLGKVIPPAVVSRFKSISLSDRSLVIRFHATLDALLISKDHPFGVGAGGWNALYHMYQKTLYWFTETHNHFAQVLVETGFPGFILYAFFWVGLISAFVGALVYFKKNRPANLMEASSQVRWFSGTVGLGMGVFSLGFHSSADFDLSLPAITIALFTAMGLFLSHVQTKVKIPPSVPELGSLLRGRLILKARNAGSIRPAQKREAASIPKGTKERDFTKGTSSDTQLSAGSYSSIQEDLSSSTIWRAAGILIVAAISIFNIKVSSNYFRGIEFGAAGVYAVAHGNVSDGRQYLLSALKYDPHNSEYAMNLARTYAQEYETSGDDGAKGMAKLYLDLAKRLDPLNLQDRVDSTTILYALGFYDDSVTSAEEVLRLCPLDKSMYDLFSTCARKAMWQHLEAWETAVKENNQDKAEKEKGHITQLITYVSQIPTTLSEKKEAVKGTYAAVWNASELDPTPGTLLVMGEAAYLQGNDAKALEYLSQAAKDKNLANEANTWLYSLSIATGANVALPGGFKPDQKSAQVIVQAHGWAK